MEEVYIKNYPRQWHSDITDLKEYFSKYSAAYNGIIKRNKMSLTRIVNLLLPDDSHLDKKKLTEIIKSTNEIEKDLHSELARPLFTKNMLLKRPSVRSVKKNIKESKLNKHVGNRKQTNHLKSKHLANTEEESEAANTSPGKEEGKTHTTDAKAGSTDESILNTFRFKGLTKPPKYKHSVLTPRRELLLDEESHQKKNDLKKGNHFLVAFRVHEPFTRNCKFRKIQQEILVLGHQTLMDLRNKIICSSDFQDVRGDVSNDPDSPVSVSSKDLYNSAMFYLGNTFYVDYWGDVDYSKSVKEWAKPRGIKLGETKSMGETRISDLKLRFGYPYLYMHQGCCEHIVIISDARLLSGTDSLNLSDYPRMSRICRPNTQKCFTCNIKPSKWIVTNNKRLLKDVTFLCATCFKSFNYIDGKKCGNFKAYRFVQKSFLL